MGEIKRMYFYETTDGLSFTGKSAKKKANYHQDELNREQASSEALEKARKVLGLDGGKDDFEGKEEEIVEELCDIFHLHEVDLQSTIKHLQNVHSDTPEVLSLLTMIDDISKEDKGPWI